MLSTGIRCIDWKAKTSTSWPRNGIDLRKANLFIKAKLVWPEAEAPNIQRRDTSAIRNYKRSKMDNKIRPISPAIPPCISKTPKGRKFSASTGSIRLKQPTPHEGTQYTKSLLPINPWCGQMGRLRWCSLWCKVDLSDFRRKHLTPLLSWELGEADSQD